MKKIFCFTLTFIFSLAIISTTSAQSISKHCNIWYFNFNCGIDFNSGAPVAINNSAMSTDEGCTSICDTDGVLLFYTNGVTVYNANHQTMFNGTGLNGGYSASQSCIAMQQPGSYTTWYLFTVAEAGGNQGANYSIIDMTQQAGLGAVTVKNVALVTPVEEKLTATLQANGTDFWILVHGNGTKKFYAFPLTSAGVGSAVVSTAGSACSTWVGCMKFSPDGTKVAEAQYDLHTFQVFDFDKTTGVVTYDFTLPCGSSFASYGVEWSRNSQHLFCGNVDWMPGQVWEVDMSLGDTTSIIASLTLVVNAPADILGSLQMAPDGNIYLNRYNVYYLGVINEPDSFGVAVNYVSNGFSTSPHYNYLGLPNYVTSFYSDTILQPSAAAAFAASSTDLCEKFCIDFHDSSLNNPTGWLWTFAGGSPPTSTQQNPANICYQVPGVYDVTLVVTNASGADTLMLPSYITVNPTPPFPVITQAGYTLTSTASSSFQWQLNSYDIPGATNQSYTIMQTGFYTVIVGDTNGCNNSATLYVLISGIDEMNDAAISISPNPSNGNFIVEFTNNFSEGEISIGVLNAIGQKVFSSQQKVSSTDWKKEISLGSVPTGIYFVEIKSGSEFVRKKILID